jgi:hypothetical protein
MWFLHGFVHGIAVRAFRPGRLSTRDPNRSALIDADNPQAVVVGEVPEILQVQGRQRQITNQAARRNSSAVHRARTAPPLRACLQFTPADRYQLRIRQRDDVLPPISQLGQLAWSPASQHRPLGQFAYRYERDTPRRPSAVPVAGSPDDRDRSLGATLGAIRANDFLRFRTDMNSRQEHGRGHGLIWTAPDARTWNYGSALLEVGACPSPPPRRQRPRAHPVPYPRRGRSGSPRCA